MDGDVQVSSRLHKRLDEVAIGIGPKSRSLSSGCSLIAIEKGIVYLYYITQVCTYCSFVSLGVTRPNPMHYSLSLCHLFANQGGL